MGCGLGLRRVCLDTYKHGLWEELLFLPGGQGVVFTLKRTRKESEVSQLYELHISRFLTHILQSVASFAHLNHLHPDYIDEVDIFQ